MTTVILGADSALGSELVTHLQAREQTCVKIAIGDTALDKPRLLMNAFAVHKPEFVVNLACRELLASDDETDHKRAMRVLKNVCRATRHYNAALIHVSDCDVFAGRRSGVYREHDRPDAEGDRVKRMVKAESYARRRVPRHILLRPGPLISAQGDNVFTRIISRMQKGERLAFSPDKLSLTPAADVARVIAAIIQQLDCGAEAWGVYHYCCKDATDLYGFAEAILAVGAQYGSLDTDKVQITLNEGEGSHVILSCKQILSAFGIKQRTWRHSLPSIVTEYSR